MEDNYNKDYYNKNKAFILDLQRSRYAEDEEYRQKTNDNAKKRYQALTSTPEGREAYNARNREYVRRYRAKKKSNP